MRPDSSADLPTDEEGRVMHLQVCRGQVANRILSVGDAGRAGRLAVALFDDGKYALHNSSRGFAVYTGMYKDVPVSIIATGMGVAMIDFVVRETAAVVPGQMAIVRLGTCGGLGTTAPGSVVVASKGSVLVRREPDLAHAAIAASGTAAAAAPTAASPSSVDFEGFSGTEECPYSVSRLVLADDGLSARYAVSLRQALNETRATPGSPDLSGYPVTEGVGATGDSFYSSQGRATSIFDDRNGALVDKLEAMVPGVAALEMETFQLLSLAQSSRGKIVASSATIALVSRHTGKWLAAEHMQPLELAGGRAAFAALRATPLTGELKPAELELDCKYATGGHFAPHADGVVTISDSGERSFLTFMIYLDDVPAERLGATRFFRMPKDCIPDDPLLIRDDIGRMTGAETHVEAKVQPEAGMAIVFRQATVLHDGEPVSSGVKSILRSDILYKRVEGSSTAPTEEQVEGLKLHKLAADAEVAGDYSRAMKLYSRAYKLFPELEYTGGPT